MPAKTLTAKLSMIRYIKGMDEEYSLLIEEGTDTNGSMGWVDHITPSQALILKMMGVPCEDARSGDVEPPK